MTPYSYDTYLRTPCVCDQHTCGNPDSKVHGANMGPIWGRQDPGGPHVDPMNLVIWEEACGLKLGVAVSKVCGKNDQYISMQSSLLCAKGTQMFGTFRYSAGIPTFFGGKPLASVVTKLLYVCMRLCVVYDTEWSYSSLTNTGVPSGLSWTSGGLEQIVWCAIFQHKTWYILIHSPYTLIVILTYQ